MLRSSIEKTQIQIGIPFKFTKLKEEDKGTRKDEEKEREVGAWEIANNKKERKKGRRRD